MHRYVVYTYRMGSRVEALYLTAYAHECDIVTVRDRRLKLPVLLGYVA